MIDTPGIPASTNPPEPCEWCNGVAHPRLVLIGPNHRLIHHWCKLHHFNPLCPRLVEYTGAFDNHIIFRLSPGLMEYLIVEGEGLGDQLEPMMAALASRDFTETPWVPPFPANDSGQPE